MTALGTLPSKSSVTITIDTNGNNARIEGATPQQAGVMTAEQARILEQVRLLLASGNFASNVVSLGQLAPTLPIGDLSLPSPVEVLPPNHSDDLARRVAALERRGNSSNDIASVSNAITQFRDQVAARISAIEKRLAALETNDNNPTSELNQLRDEMNEMRPMLDIIQSMIEDPTPVMVEQ